MQTILRTAGVEDPYDLLKQVTRGRAVTREALMALVDGLDIPDDVKARCHALQVRDYTGLARVVCDRIIARVDEVLGTEEEA